MIGKITDRLPQTITTNAQQHIPIMTTPKELEKIVKGAANHWRIRILLLLESEEPISLGDIARKVEGHFKTISSHTRRLFESGLVAKRYRDQTVFHTLTPLGQKLLQQLKRLPKVRIRHSRPDRESRTKMRI